MGRKARQDRAVCGRCAKRVVLRRDLCYRCIQAESIDQEKIRKYIDMQQNGTLAEYCARVLRGET